MNKDQAEALRAPFGKGDINQIPRKNHKTGAIIKLDYVGHAAVTDRLLEVDPNWTWEPMGKLPTGAPAVEVDEFNRPIGLWINLTVCGVTRPGYGYVDQPAKQSDKPLTEATESTKQLISDAIRNAAMRFGVALDLWRKEDKHVSTEGYGERQRPEPRQTPPSRPEAAQSPSEAPSPDLAERALMIAARKKVKEVHKQHPKVVSGEIQQMSWAELQQEWPEEAKS